MFRLQCEFTYAFNNVVAARLRTNLKESGISQLHRRRRPTETSTCTIRLLEERKSSFIYKRFYKLIGEKNIDIVGDGGAKRLRQQQTCVYELKHFRKNHHHIEHAAGILQKTERKEKKGKKGEKNAKTKLDNRDAKACARNKRPICANQPSFFCVLSKNVRFVCVLKRRGREVEYCPVVDDFGVGTERRRRTGRASKTISIPSCPCT